MSRPLSPDAALPGAGHLLRVLGRFQRYPGAGDLVLGMPRSVSLTASVDF